MQTQKIQSPTTDQMLSSFDQQHQQPVKDLMNYFKTQNAAERQPSDTALQDGLAAAHLALNREVVVEPIEPVQPDSNLQHV